MDIVLQFCLYRLSCFVKSEKANLFAFARGMYFSNKLNIIFIVSDILQKIVNVVLFSLLLCKQCLQCCGFSYYCFNSNCIPVLVLYEFIVYTQKLFFKMKKTFPKSVMIVWTTLNFKCYCNGKRESLNP